jgi:hypothetical protein
MIDGNVDRTLATDPRIANKKQVELHTSAIIFLQDGKALVPTGRKSTWQQVDGRTVLFSHPRY